MERLFSTACHRKKNVDEDIKNEQSGARYQGIPISIINATTGINAIDNAIKKLYQTGYMHNHHRMYVASLVCNQARVTGRMAHSGCTITCSMVIGPAMHAAGSG